MSIVQIRLNVVVATLTSVLLSCSASGQSTPELRVTVIVVSEFTKDATLQKDPLGPIARQAAGTIADYFKSFGIKPKILQTANETSKTNLRKSLEEDLRYDTSRTLHLVFMLSHGWMEPTSKGRPSRFYFATSDTELGNTDSALSGAEILEPVPYLQKGASVFFIIDACSSGAMDADFIHKELSSLSSDPQVQIRTVLLMSSLKDRESYSARLSQALVDVWQPKNANSRKDQNSKEDPNQRHCGPDIEPFLDSRLASLNNASALEQHVRLINEYSPSFCIQSFRQDLALAVFYNSSDEIVKLTIKDDTDKSAPQIGPRLLQKKQLFPQVLNRHQYAYSVEPTEKNSDLKETGNLLNLTKPYFVEIQALYSMSDIENANLHSRSAELAESWGAAEKEVDNLNQIASRLFQRGLQSAEKQSKRAAQNEESSTKSLDKLTAEKKSKEEELNDAASKIAQIEALMSQNHSPWEAIKLQRDLMAAQAKFGRLQDQVTHIAARAEEEQKKRSAAQSSKEEAEGQVKDADKGLQELQLRSRNKSELLALRQTLFNHLATVASVTETPRGIDIMLPTMPAEADSEKYDHVIQIVNTQKGASAELEVTVHMPNPDLQSRNSGVGTADAWRTYLIDHGLHVGHMISRSFVQIDAVGLSETHLIISVQP